LHHKLKIMNAKIFFFSLLIAGCTPGDPVIADYRGQVLEYGTEDVIEGAQVKLLNPVFSGPTGAGSYQTVWQGTTDHQGVFSAPWTDEMQLVYCVGDSTFFDLGQHQAAWMEREEPLQKLYLMGKSPLVLNIQDTGQAQTISHLELFPFSPSTDEVINVPHHSFPFFSEVFANYPLSLSYRVHFLNGQTSEILTRSFLTGSRGDTSHIVLPY